MKRTRLCVCRDNRDRQECLIMDLINDEAGNRFSTLGDLRRLATSMQTPEPQDNVGLPDVKPGYKVWKWTKVEQCYMYYVFVYGGDSDSSERVREHEIVAPPDKFTHQVPQRLTLRVIPLFKMPLEDNQASDHAFVDIFPASGVGEYGLVVDLLSPVILEGRYAIYFGFLTTGHEKFNRSTRVAIKKVDIADITSEGRRLSVASADRATEGGSRDALEKDVAQIRKEIDLALQAGGRYNMKYWACTKIVPHHEIWIAMELCRMEIFKDLINADENSPIHINHHDIKVCFNHILQGLMQLHSQGIKHGQITTENILVSLDGAELKIGDYDHVKEVKNGGADEETTIQDDIMMTARVFLKCLKRDVEYHCNVLRQANEEHVVQWVTSVQEMPDPGVLNDETVNLLLKIARVAFYDTKPDSIRNIITTSVINRSQSISWFKLLLKLADELRGNCEEPYLSAYLIIHMAVDEPQAHEIRKHPFFYDVHKMECFTRRMFDKWSDDEPNEPSDANSRVQNEQLHLIHTSILQDFHKARAKIECLSNICVRDNSEWAEVLLKNKKHLSSAVCLLHRAVWLRRRPAGQLPLHIRGFLDDESTLDTLHLPRSY